MSGNINGVGDTDGNASSKAENESQTVSYESHKRLLDQRKKDQEDLRAERSKREALEAKLAEDEQKKLEEQGNFKKISEDLKQKLEEKEKNLFALDKKVKDSQKIAAFKSKLPGELSHKDFLSFVKIDAIQFDSNGDIDENSVKAEVERFSSIYPDVIKRKSEADLPNNKAEYSSTKLTKEEYEKLPLAEMKKRIKDVQF